MSLAAVEEEEMEAEVEAAVAGAGKDEPGIAVAGARPAVAAVLTMTHHSLRGMEVLAGVQ